LVKKKEAEDIVR